MVIAIIPARGGSKGIPNKNLEKIGGIRLIERTLEAAMSSEYIQQIFITTDMTTENFVWSDRVVQLDRPPELAQDHVQVDEVILFAYRQIEQEYGSNHTVVILQPTSPFRTAEHIDAALELYNAVNYPQPPFHEFSSVMGVCSEDSFYYQNAGQTMEPLGHDPRLRLGRQETDFYENEVLRENGSIYIVHGPRLSRERSFRLSPIVPFRMDKMSSHEIDTPGDLVIARAMLENKELFE